MTKTHEEPNKNIAVAGFSNVKIDNVNAFLEQLKNEKVTIQFFNAKKVAGQEHLYFAALNALNAFKKNVNISNNIAVESLIYASAQRQIKKAVDMLGINKASSEVVALIIAENAQAKKEGLDLVTKMVLGERDDGVVDLSTDKIRSIRSLFGISDLEFEAKLEKEGLEKRALTDLVIERMALLVTRS